MSYHVTGRLTLLSIEVAYDISTGTTTRVARNGLLLEGLISHMIKLRWTQGFYVVRVAGA
jgi:hypothetical protein